MAHFRSIILDVDGTLIDSNDAHARAWVAALKEHGYDVSFERVRSLIGKGGDKLLPEVANLDKDSQQGRQISERRGEILNHRYIPQLRAFPQARALLQRMRDDGYKLAVASSSQPDELQTLLKITNVQDLLEETTSSGDAKSSKPDPDIIQVALDKLNEEASHTIMLGDTPYDVESASKASVAVIALRCGGWRDEDLRGALAIYDDPADLLAHYDESPLAQQRESEATR